MNKGDFISTDGMSTDEYAQVVQAFKDAGAGGDFSKPVRIGEGLYLMWDDENDIDAGPELHRCSGKELALEDVFVTH